MALTSSLQRTRLLSIYDCALTICTCSTRQVELHSPFHAFACSARDLHGAHHYLMAKLADQHVRSVQPSWFAIMSEGATETAQPGSSTLDAMPADDTWRSPWIAADKLPYPRFEHSCCVLGSKMYLFGGNCGAHACTLSIALHTDDNLHARLITSPCYMPITSTAHSLCIQPLVADAPATP